MKSLRSHSVVRGISPVWDTTFPLKFFFFLFLNKKADDLCKNEYHSKYHSEGRISYMS